MNARKLAMVTACAALAIALTVATATEAATISVSGATHLTANGEYDRNPSVVYDGSDYWLFWTKGDDTSTAGVRTGGYNPDADTYVIYYKTAGTLTGLATASETKLGLSETARPTGFDQRVVSAAVFGGDIYAFASSGQSGTDRGLYYYKWDGASWTGPTTLIADATARGGHVNVASDGGYVYIVWESSADASSDMYTWDGTTLSSKVDISTDNLAKVTVDGATLYVVSIEDGTGDIEVYSASAGATPSFSVHSTPVPSGGFYDPCIVSDGTDLHVITAPWLSGTDQQYLVETEYSGGSWSATNSVTLGGYSGVYWWDYWPIAYYDGSDVYVFFTTETSSPSFSDGEIAMLKMDWDLATDHYLYVQNAVDQASSGDLVDVAEGTYVEQVTVNKSLQIDGAGEGVTTIEAPATRTGTVAQGTNTWDYIVGVWANSGTIDVSVSDFTLDAAGHGKSAGTSGLVAAYLCDVDGTGAGLFDCTIEGFEAVEYESWGARVHGASVCSVDGNTLTDYTRDGIVVNGDDGAGTDPTVLVADNDLTGNALCLNGIQVGYGATAEVYGNTVRDHTRSSPWAAVGLYAHQSPGVDFGAVGSGNTVTNCKYGLVLDQSDGCSVVGNDFDENLSFHIGVDDSDNCTIAANTLTSTSVVPDKAIGISNGSDGNMIGGTTAADGNIIAMPTSGGLLYGIYTVGTTGSGSNTVRYNTFTGGTRFVQCDGGYSGTITVQDNTVSDCSFAGVYINGGSGVIERNTMTNTTRPVEFWGAGSVTVTDNLFDGASFEGINAGAYSGTVTVSGNAFENIAGASLNNHVATHLDASGNWWGTADATGVSSEIIGTVDYTPWLGVYNDTSTDPGYQADYSVLGVDDCPQTGSTGRITEAIGLVSGSTINVAAGTYAERLNITKSLDLIGPQDGVDPTAAGARTNPANEAVIDITGLSPGNPNVAVEIPSGVSDVTVSGFTVKGSPTSHYADESNIRVWDDDVTIEDNILEGYIGVLYKGADNLDVLTNRMVVNKNGVVLQPGAATNAEVSRNHFTLGSSPAGDESAIYATSVTGLTISDNTATGFVNGKGAGGSSITDLDITGNTFTGNKDAVSFWGATTFVCISGNDLSNSTRYGVSIKGQDIDISNNLINSCGDVGVNIDRHTIDTERVAVNHNSLVGNTNYGIYVNTASVTETVDGEMNWWGSDTGPTHTGNSGGTGDACSDGVDYDPWIGKTGGENVVCVPDDIELNYSDDDETISVDYLGGASDLLFGFSVTFTWDPAKVSMDDVAPGDIFPGVAGTDFTFFEIPGTGTHTVDCTRLGTASGVAGPGTLFTIDLSAAGCGSDAIAITSILFRDNGNVPLTGVYASGASIEVDTDVPVITSLTVDNLDNPYFDDWAKDDDDLVIEATVTDACGDADDVTVVADLSTLLVSGSSAAAPTDYTGGTATWNLDDVELKADGDKVVTVTVTDLLGNSSSDDITVHVDNTDPVAVTDLVAAPGHNQAELTWTNDPGTYDANFHEYAIKSRSWGDAGYPTYPVAGTPAYPATAGDGDLVDENVTGGSYTATYASDGSERSILYYGVFARDKAGNYGPAGTGDRCTNYWLGDVATTLGTWGYNGLVNAADIGKLGGAYGQAPAPGVPGNVECDVGPTDDNSRIGIPEPDDFVSFEDLMIFAMNYDVVAPRIVPFLSDPAEGELALVLSAAGQSGDVLTLALRLEGNVGDVKGLTTELEFTGLEFLSAGLSDEMSAPVADVFFWSDATAHSAQVDVAVLGTDVTIGGSGDVATLMFRVLDDAYSVDFVSAGLRGAENDDLTAELKGVSSDEVPASFKLVQNTPNPFNPVTTVGYHVPSESRVTIRVYDVTGRLVTTLVDGVVEPGRHTVAWNGTSDTGESVGSGVYFCTMETPDYHGSQKMTLLK